ncbi:DUF6086 family protein [Nocardia sp. NPDC058658]|uniref:DUF6086 family protein n=1 Tax=Nocardia sp. NPDC058658 TaxID=3346580 RepID=UPI00364F53C9
MSQYYDVDNQTLWNPSNTASKLFLYQVRLFEEELDLQSGIGPMKSDESRVAPVVLEQFVNALLAWRERTNHAVIQALTDGFVATMLVLAERAGVEVRWNPSADAGADGMHEVQVCSSPMSAGHDRNGYVEIREQARQLADSMPR